MTSFLLIAASLFSFMVCIVTIPMLIKISIKKDWFDDIDHRKIHTGNISRLAGVAVFYSMIAGIILGLFIMKTLGYLPEGVPSGRIAAFFGAYIIIHSIGLIDDFKNIRPRYKFIAQIVAALIIMIPGRAFSMLHIPFFNVTLDIGIFGYVLTAVWIIGACNAVNLIDGMDGLSGGITAIAALTLALIAVVLGNMLTAIIAFTLFGSLLGFLVFNFPPAKIFMGDSGALFLGFALATLPLLEINYYSDFGFIIGVSILFIPVIDTLTSMLRRIRRGHSPFHPDREHLHHKLMDRGFSEKKILFTIYTVSGLIGLSVFLWAVTQNLLIINITIVIWIIIIIASLMLEKHHANNN